MSMVSSSMQLPSTICPEAHSVQAPGKIRVYPAVLSHPQGRPPSSPTIANLHVVHVFSSEQLRQFHGQAKIY